MSYRIKQASDQIQYDVPNTEASIDQALASVSELMTTLVNARLSTNVPGATGQIAIRRLAKAQTSLLEASSEVLRAHEELLKVGREYAGLDIDECPPAIASNENLKAVA